MITYYAKMHILARKTQVQKERNRKKNEIHKRDFPTTTKAEVVVKKPKE